MSESGYFKIACASCNGHIEFPKEMYWQKIPCPHCGLSTVLGVTGKPKKSKAITPSPEEGYEPYFKLSKRDY
jgi:predicted RNA-binding Zn-ribbon protein involved in translation (DUF1610 family)